MIRFQDPSEYVLGTCSFMLADTTSGDIKYWDNKFKTNNIEASDSPVELTGGLGDKLLTVISSGARLKVTASSQNFNLVAKGMTVGSMPNYNATVMTCQKITATGTSLTINVAGATPVAKQGYASIFCYVTEEDVQNTVAMHGTAYPLNPTTGAISDFTATSGKDYLVWYYIKKATSKELPVPSHFVPGIYNATAKIPVYRNQANAAEDNHGTQSAWLYYCIPYLRLNPSLKVTGDQTTADTTDLSGQALAADDLVETGENVDYCSAGGNYAYIIYDPIDSSEGISGLVIIGGTLSMGTTDTLQIPVKYVMDNNQIVQPQYSDLKFEIVTPVSNLTVGENTGILTTSGATAGDTEVKVSYPKTGTAQYTCVANLSITA